ncbi:MAG TPA: DNA mismatch repair endonuclease MutL [Planctomycetota bacterium]
MNPIRKLDPVVVDQIAAGEVVERPASVVKELVENALDAGATRIEVLLREGGARLIEVRDDGGGIPAEQLLLAVASHATSKLRRPSDFEAIASMGFRGEALASIGAVSRLRMISRPPAAPAAAAVTVRFGAVSGPAAAAGPPGTRVVVEDLFAELPARRKFLKRTSTEYAHCSAWVERLALAHPGVGLRLEHDGRRGFEVAPDDGIRERCAAVFGARLAERMVVVEETHGDLHLHAQVGPPEAARRDASRVHLFLNGRWVRDPKLLRAVREGVREFVPVGHYPTLYLALTMPPAQVDVNVHPQKLEVRFRNASFVFSAIVRTLRSGLSRSAWATRRVGAVGEGGAGLAETSLEAGVGASSALEYRPDFPSGPAVWERPAGAPLPASGAVATRATAADGAAADGAFRIGGLLSVANTFLVREVPGGMEILDQHALHERVNLEELRAEVRRGRVVAQPMLVPALVEVTREELADLVVHAQSLAVLGLELAAFGETTVAVRAVPSRLTRLQPERVVADVLELLAEHGEAGAETLQDEVLQRMACRGAVMAGDRLDTSALQDLLRRGAALPQDKTCAHGRPVRVFLTLEDLERAFHRR